MVSVMNGLVIHCMKYQRWLHLRCSDVPQQVSLPFCQDVHNFSVEGKLEFKRGKYVLRVVKNFCYLGDMILLWWTVFGSECRNW